MTTLLSQAAAYRRTSPPTEPAARMLAVVADGYGSADVLQATNVPIPRPRVDEVLVRDVSVGDEVYGIGRGTFAQFSLVDARRLARKPVNLSFTQAAVVPVSGLTALQALRDAGRVQPGQHVLVTGASGGVGAYAVQLAVAFGAHVTGVCSPAKADFVRSLGAEHVVDHTSSDFAAGPRRYDLIVDIAGSPTLARLRAALTPTGTAVLVGEEEDQLTGGMVRQLRGLALSSTGRRRFTGFLSRETERGE